MSAGHGLGGTLKAGRHRLAVRIYYEDTDFSGVVYHASYLRLLERGRTEYLRALGIAQSELRVGDAAAAFAVRRMTIEFLRPARMDDVVVVDTSLERVGGASIDLSQRIVRGAEPLVTAAVSVALVAAGRPARLPEPLRAKLRPTTSAPAGGGAGTAP